MLLKFILTTSYALVSSAAALTMPSITDCPTLTPRSTPATDVTDLRVDDIKVIACLGDSIAAGYAMMNVNDGIFGLFNLHTVTEHRGLSYLMGADEGAVSVANFIKHYNPDLHGPSVGAHIVSPLSRNIITPYYQSKDYLNAAKTGAMALNLDFELDYLIPRLTDNTIVDAKDQNGWKLININIGGNDMCRACDAEFAENTTAEEYGNYVEKAIQRIQASVPNVLVNLFGMVKFTAVQTMKVNNADYCKNAKILDHCTCFETPDGLSKLDTLHEQYDEKLMAIANKYAAKPGSTFGVTFTPLPIDLNTLPLTAFSNIDCFHLSLIGHQWVAKAIWNQMFITKGLRASSIRFGHNDQIYCPVDNDRLIV